MDVRDSVDKDGKQKNSPESRILTCAAPWPSRITAISNRRFTAHAACTHARSLGRAFYRVLEGCVRLIVLAEIANSLLFYVAHAQGLGIEVEGKGNARKHLDFAGKPCLSTEGVARPLSSNPRIMNHVVTFNNHCFERIRLKVCYSGTDDCTDVEVPPYGRKEQIIGVLPALQLFRYDVKEQF
jgi:hypothetical protein